MCEEGARESRLHFYFGSSGFGFRALNKTEKRQIVQGSFRARIYNARVSCPIFSAFPTQLCVYQTQFFVY